MGQVNWKRMGKRVAHQVSADHLSTLAAALAYYAVFSLPAVLLVAIYVAGAVYGRAAVSGQIESRIGEVAGAGVASQLQTAIQNASQHSGGVLATVLGIGGILFSATRVFGELQAALNRTWNVRPAESGWKNFAAKRLTSFLMMLGIGAVVLAALVAGSVISAVASAGGLPIPDWLWYVIEIAIALAIFTLVCAAVFKIVPDAQIAWADVWAGAGATAALFFAGTFLISIYLSHSGTASVYGAAGSLALLLLWCYYSSWILLLGAEFTQVWAEEHGRALDPEEGAIRENARRSA